MLNNFLVFLIRLIPNWLKGKNRIAKILLRNYCSNASDVYIKLDSGESILVPNVNEPVAFSVLISGVYEPDVFKVIKNNIGKGDVFVDVGANIGCFSIPLANIVGPLGRIHSFEASPFVSSYLKKNIEYNGLANIVFNNFAVSDKFGDVSFYDAPVNKFGMGGLAPVNLDSPSTKVKSVTLDDYFNPPCKIKILKIDVEGFEISVLKGASDLLLNDYVELVIFEFLDWAESRVPTCNPGDSQRYLMKLGFHIWILSEYVNGGPPLKNAIETGGEMLVAKKASYE